MDYKVRDPIHGFIRFNDKEREIINSHYFQRLRHIRQLALTSYVYPGALHSRFEHSLGVMEVAGRMFESVYQKNKTRISKELKKIMLGVDEAKAVLRLAALFHDTGHLPFSHGAESILPEGKKHEHVSVCVLEAEAEKLGALYFKDAAKIVSSLLLEEYPSEIKLLKDIISGNIDADRTDYLIRDSYFCGVDYGKFDFKRLIESLTISEDYGKINLAINSDGVHALEALILARYYMFTQVYFHKTRRIYDIYLKQFMSGLNLITQGNLTSIIQYDDSDVIQRMRKDKDSDKNAYRIVTRINHSSIYDSSEFAAPEERRQLSLIKSKLEKKYRDIDFCIDQDDKASNIHKFNRSEVEDKGEMFYVFRGSEKLLVTQESKILAKMPDKFSLTRLYASPNNHIEKLSITLRDNLRKEVLRLKKEMV